MLDRPEIFIQDTSTSLSSTDKLSSSKNSSSGRNSNSNSNTNLSSRDKDDDIPPPSPITDTSNSNKDIDDVFIKIRQIYSRYEFSILYNNLLLLEKRPEHYETYIQGINASMTPINLQIKKWINDNIVY